MSDNSLKRHVLDSLNGKRILITGGAGYLATGIVALLQTTNCVVVRMDRPGAVFRPFFGKARVEDIAADIRNCTIWEQVLKGVDFVIHLAGQTSAQLANANPLADWAVNVEPMVHLLETCRRRDLSPAVLFAGTVTQTGIPNGLPVDETHTDHPITAYDLHKCLAEDCLKYAARIGALRGVTLRLSNVFGPGPRSSGADRGVLNMMIRKAIKGETLTIYGDGTPIRDYIYADDVAFAFLCAAKSITNISGNHFVIGSGIGHTISEAVHMVANRVGTKTGFKVPIVYARQLAETPIERRNFIANTTRFTQTTGWHPTVSLSEGIDLAIDAFTKEGV